MKGFSSLDLDFLQSLASRQRQPGGDHFYIALQEDFHMAYVNANISIIAHRVIPLQSIVDLVGEEVRTYL
jgi:hypothetical protein